MINKIIYIDDDHEDREFFEQIVEDTGQKVTLISSGMHFFDYIYDELLENSLIFVDLHLPTIPGIDIILRLRKKFGVTELPIIVVSGSQDKYILDQCYESGANGFIRKTGSYNSLKGAVVDALTRNWKKHVIGRDDFFLNP